MFYKMALGAVQGATGSSEGAPAGVLVTEDQARMGWRLQWLERQEGPRSRRPSPPNPGTDSRQWVQQREWLGAAGFRLAR